MQCGPPAQATATPCVETFSRVLGGLRGFRGSRDLGF